MPDIIRSLQNPRVKQAVKLRDASARRETGLMVVEGDRELRQAIAGGLGLLEVFVPERVATGLDVPPVLQTIDPRIITFVAPQIIQKMTYGDRTDEIMAVAKQPVLDKAKLKPRSDAGLYLVIDSVEKPGNLGAMLRSADAAGVSGVLVTDPVCEIWNPNAIKASQGAIFRVPLAVFHAEEALAWLKEHSISIFAARVQASETHDSIAFPSRSAVVVGSEATGLGKVWLGEQCRGVRLPMLGSVDSLNVSVSAGILLYHVAAQIRWFRKGATASFTD
jgi:TrmH family RNA methyltransferase